MPNVDYMEIDTSANGVWIGVKLTATAVLLDTVVLTMSRAETLQYVATVSRLMLLFAAPDPQYIFDTGSQLNVTFPEEEAPGSWNKIEAEISTHFHYLVLPVGIGSQDDTHKECGAADTSLQELYDPGGA